MSKRSVSRRGRQATPSKVPRAARVNENLREVLAEALERLADTDPRLELATITAVQVDPDLRHATVLMSSLDADEAAALEEARVRLQAAISSQVRLKRTPLLRFAPDPAVASGERIDDVLRHLPHLPAADDDAWRANYRLDE